MTSAYSHKNCAPGGVRSIVVGIFCSVLLSSCATYQPKSLQVGMDRAAVLQRMGAPETERKLDTGLRLEYPNGPYGIDTWFVDLDGSSRVTRIEQVLTEENFAKVQPDMAQSDLRALLGRPGEVQKLGRDRGVVWSYRYENYKCQWFQAEISAEQKVRSAGLGIPPECLGGNDRYDP
jgi:hypothetical protein